MTTSTGHDSAQMSRLTLLVPYVKSHPGSSYAELAAEFATTPQQIEKDLHLLWVCGLPGHGPGDLIDFVLDDERATVTYDAGMDRPLQLTVAEATALIVALRTLGDTPDLNQSEAVGGALAKIESAVGDRAQVAGAITVERRSPPAVARDVTTALAEHRAMRITYYNATRDTTTERTIDPMRQFRNGGFDYLEAWCRKAEGVRVFRLDHVDSARILGEPVQTHDQAESRDLSGGVFTPRADHPLVELELTRHGRWLAEYYPVEEVTEALDGGLLARLRVADDDTLDRIVQQAGPWGLAGRSDRAVAAAVDRIVERSDKALRYYSDDLARSGRAADVGERTL